MSDTIYISRLKIPVFIGVPIEERSVSQDVEVSLELIPEDGLFGTNDEIKKTVNYYDVAQQVKAVAQKKPRKLIEQFNEEILSMLIQSYPLKSASITTYKYILSDAEHVSIKMTVQKGQGA